MATVEELLKQITGGTAPRITTPHLGYSGVYADRQHRGIDVGVPAGSRILSPISGTIVDPKTANADTGLGRAIVVRDALDNFLYFGHTLGGSLLPVGTEVTRGQQIGIVGSPATQLPGENTTGPHIHFEVRRSGMFANQLNPIGFLEGVFGQATPNVAVPPAIPAIPPTTGPVAPPSTQEPANFPPIIGNAWTSKPSEASQPGAITVPDISIVPPSHIDTPFGKWQFPGIKVGSEPILRAFLTLIAIVLVLVGIFRITGNVANPVGQIAKAVT